ncbi:hypothetical protein [Nocardia rhizosphaerihabitans]|uniref:Uncharacterized protein n=1 Tax=Nocardia rhizosphaerihabitans TaxID=1691570 RepID=A0ABQ2KJP8_9NOCA|nr:hypothetical protein [Nocardia rhizosphaerihabitans]GGN85221.1 hypothetical protein GCM10011610_39490 [Nocardia rhizosphaerihabitans]
MPGLRTPDRPEHHFRYDPAKADTYVATTSSWLGDPAAEVYARNVVADLQRAACVRPRMAKALRRWAHSPNDSQGDR